MALLFMDGFDYYAATDAIARGYSQSHAGMSAGRISGQCAVSGNNTGHAVHSLSASATTVYLGIAFRTNGSNNAENDQFDLLASGSRVFRVRLQSDSAHLDLCNGAGTVIATSNALAGGVWYYFEFKVVINGASSTVEMKRNGTVEIATTTCNLGSTAVNQFSFGSDGANSVGNSSGFDDVWVTDSAYLGDCRVEALLPTGAGATTAWTPSAGSNYQNVDDATPNGDTDYNKSKTAGQTDTYAMSDLATTGGTVYGVQYHEYVRKDSAGSRTVAPVARIGGADYAGTTRSALDSYTYIDEIRETSPATSAAWTISEVNAMEFGLKVVA